METVEKEEEGAKSRGRQEVYTRNYEFNDPKMAYQEQECSKLYTKNSGNRSIRNPTLLQSIFSPDPPISGEYLCSPSEFY